MVMKAFSNPEKHKTYSFYDLKLMQFYSKHCKNEEKKKYEMNNAILGQTKRSVSP